MQLTALYALLGHLLLCAIFGCIGAVVGWLTVSIVGSFQPFLGSFWSWLGPVLGGGAGIGFLYIFQFMRKHPEGIR